MLTVAIHQPQYLPYAGVFAKIVTCDKFIFLDNVLFSEKGFQNRNKILGPAGPLWLTIPLQAGRREKELKDVQISDDRLWKEKHLKRVSYAYGKQPYFSQVFDIYRTALIENSAFCKICISITTGLLKYIECDTEIYIASKLLPQDWKGSAFERLLDLTKSVHCSEYVSGIGGLNYFSEDAQKLFDRNNVKLTFSRFNAKPYLQKPVNKRLDSFIENLSILDLLVRFAPSECLHYLRSCHERNCLTCA